MAKDDKFILINLDDKRSKKIAEVIGNETCKKIIDYLTYNSEKSEADIADALGIKINTLEYNLKKLLHAGLIEKTKKFFWSKKGKKISLYKLAKKHIVISPKYSKPNMSALKSILPVIAAMALVVLLVGILWPSGDIDIKVDIEDLDQTTLKTFNSQSELEKFLEDNQEQGSYYGIAGLETARSASVSSDGATAEAATAGTAGIPSVARDSGGSASEYSGTNIQVQGVDEADIVKNDGKYIYAVSSGKIVIVDAYPAENLVILSEINIKNARNIFVNGDKLIVFSQDYKEGQKSVVSIYDITDRAYPDLEKEIVIDGNYVSARMIGDYVYLVANQYVNRGGIVLPGVAVDGIRKIIPATDISYFPYPDTSYTFTNILAIDINNGDYESQTYLTGASHTIYVSENNIYLTYSKRLSNKIFFEDLVEGVFIPIVPRKIADEIKNIMKSDKKSYEKERKISEIIQDYSNSLSGRERADFDKKLLDKSKDFQKEISKKLEATIIHKINIDDLDIEYLSNGEVPGRVLNQFSMDEHKGNFRIATTTGNFRDSSLNHMYVLDSDLEIIGSVEDLAEGERIFSTRFMGDRAYMVTFRQVDPLFVVDLSDPENPEVLGQLKVTGFSSYLHPYDENHIIGIGKEATPEGRVTGVKIALFDVSDVSNPIEKAKYEVKGKWSNSNALFDHKAFLFDKERELLVLPMSYTKDETNSDGIRKYEHWQGAFVFNINEDSISLRGEIDHKEETDAQGYYYGPYAVQRSLYMDDILYTISRSLIKANDLDTLAELNKVKLPYDEGDYRIAVSGVSSVGSAGETDAVIAVEETSFRRDIAVRPRIK